MIEKSSSVEPNGEMFVIKAVVAIEITLKQEITININKDEMKNAESLTWFHLDDFEGCQLSVLFVSCLIFPPKDKHKCLLWCQQQTLTAAQFQLPSGLAGASLVTFQTCDAEEISLLLTFFGSVHKRLSSLAANAFCCCCWRT